MVHTIKGDDEAMIVYKVTETIAELLDAEKCLARLDDRKYVAEALNIQIAGSTAEMGAAEARSFEETRPLPVSMTVSGANNVVAGGDLNIGGPNDAI